MSEFSVFFQTGLHHVLDFAGFDHILFIGALSLPYGFRDWKALLLQVTVFTIGHTLSLFLSAMDLFRVPVATIELLIPATILATAFVRMSNPGKAPARGNIQFVTAMTLVFGLVHGFGFSNYFNSILVGGLSDKVIPLLGFAAGIEIAQCLVVLSVLGLSVVFIHLLKKSKRDFNLCGAALIAGAAIPLFIEKMLELF